MLRGRRVRFIPCIVHLDNAAIAAPDLPDRLTGWEARGHAGDPDGGHARRAAPDDRATPTQRRIDLLAIEQNAWVLAARDPRCVVVASRTEIDWAMKQRQVIVWAPSKLVLDAVDGPERARSAGAGVVAGRSAGGRPACWFRVAAPCRGEAAFRSSICPAEACQAPSHAADPAPCATIAPLPRPMLPAPMVPLRWPAAGAGSTGSRCCRVRQRPYLIPRPTCQRGALRV
jgi:hypothetical protein